MERFYFLSTYYMPRFAHNANLTHYTSYTPPCKYNHDKVTVHRRRHTHHTYGIPAAAMPNETPEPHEDGNTKLGENTVEKDYKP